MSEESLVRVLVKQPFFNFLSSPLDFPSEKSFLLFFAHEKGLGNMFQK